MVSNNLIPQKNFNLPFKLHQVMFRIKKKKFKRFSFVLCKNPQQKPV